MARFKSQRMARYNALIAEHFTPLESRELSKLPKSTPALKQIREDRVVRWEKFERFATNKIDRGYWRPQDVKSKWITNLARLYYKRDWRVKHGAVGNQPKMLKGSPNPWAMYRDYTRITGGPDAKGYVSPWELKQIKSGKTALDKGLIFIQRKALSGGSVTGVPKPMIQKWIDEKNLAIVKARGQHRRDLITQRDRLKKEL